MDIDLGITCVERCSNFEAGEGLVLTCQGVCGSALVGFDLFVKKKFPWGLREHGPSGAEPTRTFDFNEKGWVHGGVVMLPRPGETASLLEFLKSHFEMEPLRAESAQTVRTLPFDALAFAPEERDVETKASQIKLSRQREAQGHLSCWEAFLRIDPQIGAIRLEEKDTSFRQAQIDDLALLCGARDSM